MESDLVSLASNLGLASAAIYAARYLAGRLEHTTERLIMVLTDQIAENNRLLQEVRDRVEKCQRRDE